MRAIPWIDSTGQADVASVLIAAYNGAGIVCEALDSVQRQTYRPIELVIVDDGSRDDTAAVVDRWVARNETPDLRCVRVSKANGGLLSTRNAGVLSSSGEFIQFLDQDDLLHPHKLQLCIQTLRERACDVAIGSWVNFRHLPEIEPTLVGPPPPRTWDLDWAAHKGRSHYARAYWGYLSPVYRRSVVAAAGPLPEHLEISAAEEMEHHARIKLQRPSVEYLPFLLSYHRLTPGSITHNSGRTIREMARASPLIAGMLLAGKIRDRIEWTYLTRVALTMLWRSVRYTQDPIAFRWSLCGLALSLRGLLTSTSG